MTTRSKGRVVWHDLMVADTAKAINFYTKLFNWTIEEFDMGEQGKYPMIKVGDKTIGGFMPPPGEGLPAHWIGYFACDDVDASLLTVKEMNGTAMGEPMDIPDVGRCAFAADPTGAAFALFSGGNEEEEDGQKPALWEFCWDELMTPDIEAAMTFYGNLFGYNYTDMNPDGEDVYKVANQGELERAGIMKFPEAVPYNAPPVPHWQTYVVVDHLEKRFRHAINMGATEIMPPMELPNVGRMALIQDPFGAVLGLFTE